MKIWVSLIMLMFLNNVVNAETIKLKSGKIIEDEVVMKIETITNENPFITENKFYIGDKEIAKQRWEMNVEGYLDGGPAKTLVYEEGKIPDGSVKVYYPTGELFREDNYKNNQLDGISRSYYQNGILKDEAYFKNGEMIRIKQFNESGSLMQEGTFVNNQPKSVKKYDLDGNVIEEMEF
ncbi:hypothetical protein KAR91_04510 [Candidatus Pacearchaeota archaeon]|nr:hypothetical protein [Candidatus Pacearchaeota archaeon]